MDNNIMDSIYYEIIVRDDRGDRHRHVTDILPSPEDEDYCNGELVIDISEDECVRYMLGHVISWSYRVINDSPINRSEAKALEVFGK